MVPAVVFLGAAVLLLPLVLPACRTAPHDEFTVSLEGVAPEVATAVKGALAQANAGEPTADKWLTLGMICDANGMIGDARRAYERAVQLDPNNAHAWYHLAIVRGRGGHVDEALAAIDRTISIDGNYAPAHWRRGLWLVDAGRDADARASFEKATVVDPANAGGWIGLARLSLHEQQPAQAVATLERFLSDHPGDRYAVRLLGTAYKRLGRTDDADYALAIGSTGEPSWPDPWSDELARHRVGFAQNLKAATAQILNGDFTGAIPVLEQLSRERPDDLSLMHQLGLSYVAAGHATDGIALLEKALARDPDNVETHLRLASAYLNTQDYPKALDHAERAVSLDPELGRAYETKGMALWRGGRSIDALAAFEQATRYDPANVEALVWMGSILLDAGRADEALSHFERAAKRNPMLADAFIGISLVLVQRRQLADAESALHRAETIDPANPRIAPARSRLDAARASRR